MYENRYIAFIDLLGFGGLVERSASENDLPQKILSALTSLQPKSIEEDAYASINYEICTQEEIENIRAVLRKMTQSMREMHSVTITYFSDSLVLSARAEDVITSQLILDLLAKISIKLWTEHSLLLRGGLTIGKLVHVENGPLFGPAMNRAYYLESKLAKHPRIIIDNECYESYNTVETFGLFESLFESDGEFRYASLGTAYRYIINDSSLALSGEAVIGKFRSSLSETPSNLANLEATFTDGEIKKKYNWLKEEVSKRVSEVRRPLTNGLFKSLA